MVEYINTIGRRKTSVARAYMKAGGKGQITINDKKFEKYFASKLLQLIVLRIFTVKKSIHQLVVA